MQKYKTIGIIDLFSGKIGLSEKQAARRPGKLKKVGKDVSKILSPVQFKAGEVIRLDNPDKVTLSKLELIEDPKPEKGSKK